MVQISDTRHIHTINKILRNLSYKIAEKISMNRKYHRVSRHYLSSSLSHICVFHRPITKEYIKSALKERIRASGDPTHAFGEIVLVDSAIANKNGRDTFRMYVISGEPLPYL